MDFDTIGSDDLIGATTIDLEDRVFNLEWQAWRKRGSLPLEWRPLYSPCSKNPQGRLQLWVEAWSKDDRERPPPPMSEIAPPPPQRWELRCIVWRTANVESADEATGMNDLYVVVQLGGHGAQETDTHWRVGYDGDASFNWRCKWQTRLTHSPNDRLERLTLQVWDRDILSSNDAIGEAVLPLHFWFHRAFRSHAKRPEGQQQAASEGGSSWARSLHKMHSRHYEAFFGEPSKSTNLKAAILAVLRVLSELKDSLAPTDGGFQKSGKAAAAAGDKKREGGGGVGEVKKVWVPVFGKGTGGTDLRREGEETGLLADLRKLSGVADSRESGRRRPTGWVQISLELLPEALATLSPAGNGRSEPNAYPTLPRPIGRIKLSLNPFTNLVLMLGPWATAKMGCCVCGLLGGVMVSYTLLGALPVLFADLVDQLLPKWEEAVLVMLAGAIAVLLVGCLVVRVI